MKIIKRDGRVVDYDRQKISTAIEKANREVKGQEKANKDDIKNIILYIEDLEKKRMLVEDIQDIIEQQLMKIGKYELAKRYIVYRYTRALVRKSNTTDQTILGLIRNGNKDLNEKNSTPSTILASSQRDYIAGEVSRDLTKRMLLPEKIVQADEEEFLHFNDADYFIQPIFNNCFINISDMLDNGTVINNQIIETPKTFKEACLILTQILAIVGSNQYGEKYIDFSSLGKYLRRSYDNYKSEIKSKYNGKISNDLIEDLLKIRITEELKFGIKTIQYQYNSFFSTNIQSPSVRFFFNLNAEDEYIKENTMIIEEIFNETLVNCNNESQQEFPSLIFIINEHTSSNEGDFDYLTNLAQKCSHNGASISYISAKKMKENFIGRFNQGMCSINLPRIAIAANGEEDLFWSILDEKLELCKEALMCIHYALVGTISDICPLIWQFGAVSRLNTNEKIDNLLYGNNSTLTLGYTGIDELEKIMKSNLETNLQDNNFSLSIIKHLKKTIDKWKKETNIGFNLYNTSNDPFEKLSFENEIIKKIPVF